MVRRVVHNGASRHRKGVIFTEYPRMRLAKAGICFTFGPHLVKIKSLLRSLTIRMRGQQLRHSGPAIIPEERTLHAFSYGAVDYWFAIGGL
ncbi:hypothetical protein C5952_16390 [Cronobacter sakazakii]|uniref:Uncharacterized protein n=1 Tax=Cronobacter malonaticus TaxID=413503 RepID=A0A423XWX5_9ENTR|nr:hypothetical protein [Cronobacter sakazakii]EGT4371757.1 hypothetical protein [Cronobacter malonaticus]EGT4261134.1 hypothetical protein [Cronobacter sakazakii]EGT4272663.1 hypothetical protein [Cronobacter sakazakii]EGT4302932.1 hypothetical protein [Cronobacter sakazakii]